MDMLHRSDNMCKLRVNSILFPSENKKALNIASWQTNYMNQFKLNLKQQAEHRGAIVREFRVPEEKVMSK